MTKNQPQKPEKKRPGRKLGVKVRHGGYSLLTRGKLPQNRRYLRPYLSSVRTGLVLDVSGREEDLTTAQRILIDRVVTFLGVVRLMEEHAKEKGIFSNSQGMLNPALGVHYLAFNRNIKEILALLGIDKRAGAKVLDLADYIRAKDAERDEEDKATALKAKAIVRPASPGEEILGKGASVETGKDGPGDDIQGKVENEPSDDELEAEIERLEARKAALQDGAKVDE